MSTERITAERYAALAATIVDTWGHYEARPAPNGKAPT